MKIGSKRASMIWRVAYKRRGWKVHKSKTFGTEAAADRFVEKLRAGGEWTYKGDVRVLAPLVRLTKEVGTVLWEAEFDERTEEVPSDKLVVRATALDRFLSRYGHEYGSDPDDIYDLRELEQEIRNDPTE